jgi:hypothetical protein
MAPHRDADRCLLFNRDLKESIQRDRSVPELHPPSSAIPPIALAINLGGQRYTKIPVPILAIFACPHNFDFDRALSREVSAFLSDLR